MDPFEVSDRRNISGKTSTEYSSSRETYHTALTHGRDSGLNSQGEQELPFNSKPSASEFSYLPITNEYEAQDLTPRAEGSPKLWKELSEMKSRIRRLELQNESAAPTPSKTRPLSMYSMPERSTRGDMGKPTMLLLASLNRVKGSIDGVTFNMLENAANSIAAVQPRLNDDAFSKQHLDSACRSLTELSIFLMEQSHHANERSSPSDNRSIYSESIPEEKEVRSNRESLIYANPPILRGPFLPSDSRSYSIKSNGSSSIERASSLSSTGERQSNRQFPLRRSLYRSQMNKTDDVLI